MIYNINNNIIPAAAPFPNPAKKHRPEDEPGPPSSTRQAPENPVRSTRWGLEASFPMIIPARVLGTSPGHQRLPDKRRKTPSPGRCFLA